MILLIIAVVVIAAVLLVGLASDLRSRHRTGHSVQVDPHIQDIMNDTFTHSDEVGGSHDTGTRGK